MFQSTNYKTDRSAQIRKRKRRTFASLNADHDRFLHPGVTPNFWRPTDKKTYPPMHVLPSFFLLPLLKIRPLSLQSWYGFLPAWFLGRLPTITPFPGLVSGQIGEPVRRVFRGG